MPSASLKALPSMDELRPRTVTDQIFDVLYDRVVNLTLPPGSKLSESEVAAQMDVSRQPVRDAFYRLSQLGFIQIRPQRATTVTPISQEAVLQAYFIRSALEEQTIRHAATSLTAQNLTDLDALLDRQEAAVKTDSFAEFHTLDDQFHQDICKAAGLGFVWALVRENKGHMDRVRYLSLSFGAEAAFSEHRTIIAALRARDPDAAALAVRDHLGHINDILDRLRLDRPEVFG